MTDTKSLFASKTFWFGVLFTLIQFAGLFGFGDYQAPTTLVEVVNQVAGLVVIALRLVTDKGVRILP